MAQACAQADGEEVGTGEPPVVAPVPALFEPQYVSPQQFEKTRWGGETVAQVARDGSRPPGCARNNDALVDVDKAGDVGAGAGARVNDGDIPAQKTRKALRGVLHGVILALEAGNADRGMRPLVSEQVPLRGRHTTSWAGIPP